MGLRRVILSVRTAMVAGVKIVVQVKLLPTPEQAAALRACNAAA